MRISVRIFGPQARALGTGTAIVETPQECPTCADVRRALSQRYPQLAHELPACRFAVNHEFVADHTRLAAIDEVALIGQVSGG
jgi:molybdopterin converting factor small subunit